MSRPRLDSDDTLRHALIDYCLDKGVIEKIAAEKWRNPSPDTEKWLLMALLNGGNDYFAT
jgi:hypothetical protein